MAVVTPVPPTTLLGIDRVMSSAASASASPSATGGELVLLPLPLPLQLPAHDKIYVAVGREVKESRTTLIWALHNSGGKRICVFSVLVPSQKIPFLGTELPVNAVKEDKVRQHRQSERRSMDSLLDDYLRICTQMGVQAEKLYTESDSIENGILELITLHGINKLVMGAASEKRYSRRMTELKSKKAIHVRDEAPISCHIWFICNGHLIFTREGVTDQSETDAEAIISAPQMSTPSNVTELNLARSRSSPAQRDDPVKLTNPVQDMFTRVFYSNSNGRTVRLPASHSVNEHGQSLISPTLLANRSDHGWDEIVRASSSPSSLVSSSSFGPASDSASLSYSRKLMKERMPEFVQSKEASASARSSPPSVLDGSLNDNLCDQLERVLAEAENAKIAALDEAIRRGKAEKEFIDAVQRAKTFESLYIDEVKQKRDIEQELSKQEETCEKMKQERDEVLNELQIALEQKSTLESQIAESDQVVRELEQKIISAVELLQNFKKERDDLQIECNNALREAEELRTRQGENSSTATPRFYSEISFSDLREATKNFDTSLKIGEGGYGSIYRGLLRHTQVAIKVLHPHSLQGPSEFQQEVDVLSKVRHPNLITLVGACPEAWALVYEYLPNGSLEDRLICQDNSPPLPWQTRIRIAAELCAALIFLHSSKPHSIVHGDVKPANVLLDAHFVSKLGDFGICRLLHRAQGSSSNTTLLHRTDPKGTLAYMDPEFLSTGELSPMSDVYSFGIVVLRLLTGRPALGIVKEVQYAVDKGSLKSLLDPLGGDWPFVQAEQLAHLGLRCCDMNRKNRPNLGLEVWRVLEPMRAFCGGSASVGRGGDLSQPPPYFICPILLEVMQDPHVAADGYTYEAEALRGWLDSGHNTSPMTNCPLAHTNLVPNRALRSSIQEWSQSRST